MWYLHIITIIIINITVDNYSIVSIIEMEIIRSLVNSRNN